MTNQRLGAPPPEPLLLVPPELEDVVVEGRLSARLLTVAPLAGMYRMTELPESTTQMEL